MGYPSTPPSGGGTGERGPTGTQGEQGEIGPQGPQGPPGATGPQGLPGATGERGEQGLPGSMGNTGAQGVPGPQGVAGSQGSKGDTGAQGIQGVQGLDGALSIRRLRAQTNAAGVLVWTFNPPFPAGVVPIVEVTVEDATANSQWGHRISGLSNAGVTITLGKTTPVTIATVSVLGVATAPQAFVHLVAVAPAS